MNRFFTLFLLLISTTLAASEKSLVDEHIRGLGFGLEQPNVMTEIKVPVENEARLSVFTFKSNSPSLIRFNLQTKFGTWGLAIDANKGERVDLPASKVRNYYFKTQLGSFDIRFTYFDYKGAYVESLEGDKLYEDYRQKGFSLRTYYYFKKSYLDKVQFDLNKKNKMDISLNSGDWSYLVGSYYRKRNLQFPNPQNYSSLLQNIISQNNVSLPDAHESEALGISFGVDGLYHYKGYFFEGKFAFGVGYLLRNKLVSSSYSLQSKIGDIETPVNIDFNIGRIFSRHHKVQLSGDMISISNNSDDLSLNNSVLQFGINYLYSF